MNSSERWHSFPFNFAFDVRPTTRVGAFFLAHWDFVNDSSAPFKDGSFSWPATTDQNSTLSFHLGFGDL